MILSINTVGFTLFGLAAVLLAACGGSDEGSGDGQLRVVATTTQVGDFAREVGGSEVDVDILLDTNADAHDYEPTSSDARAVAEANLVLRAGLGLDSWLDELIDNAGGDAVVVDTSEGVPTLDRGGDSDPHLWFAPDNAQLIVDNIADALTHADPDNGETFTANAERYKEEIRTMDAEVEAIFAGCEPGELKMVTTHDSFGYLADRYGLQIVATALPVDTTAERSAGELAELITLVQREDVQAIFSEASLETEVEDAIADETGARVVDELYSDSLGPEGSGAETYLDMMEYNARAIVEGLGCA